MYQLLTRSGYSTNLAPIDQINVSYVGWFRHHSSRNDITIENRSREQQHSAVMKNSEIANKGPSTFNVFNQMLSFLSWIC